MSAPTLVIWGEDDALIPVDYAREFGRLIRDSRVEVIPDCGHVPALMNDEQIRVIEHWLGGEKP